MAVAPVNGPGPWWEIGSNISAAVAFFLVTIELWGPKNIERFHQALLRINLGPFDALSFPAKGARLIRWQGCFMGAPHFAF